MHQGEHGKTGYCYVTPTSKHIHLNPLQFKTWASPMVSACLLLFPNLSSFSYVQAAGDATKHEPPNVTTFDGACDGRCAGLRAHGCTGPFASTAQPARAPNPQL